MGEFKFSNTPLKDLILIEPKVFEDNRGYFFESYNYNSFLEAGLNINFVQDNRSMSTRGVLRGLHFQLNKPQGKMVSVLCGEVFDVAVDLRKESPSYGKWHGELLSSENRKQLYIPPGFAHGFLVLSNQALFAYKCTDYYDPNDESGIIWNDGTIGVKWPIDMIVEPLLSEKDRSLGAFVK